MTDKQIKEVFKNGFYCIEPCPEIKELQAELKAKEQECEKLKEKLFRKEAVIDFACCPSYGYRDNDIEPTCTKTFCYDVESCEYKTMIKYEQALTEIKQLLEDALDTDKTSAEQSFDCLYEALEKCEVIDEHN